MDGDRFWRRKTVQVLSEDSGLRTPDASTSIGFEVTARQERIQENSSGPSSSSSRLSTTGTVTNRKTHTSTTFNRVSTASITTRSSSASTSNSIWHGIDADASPEAVETTLSTSITNRRSDETAVIIQFPPPPSAMSETMGPPHMIAPDHEKTLMTPGAAAAAITLSILGVLSLIIAAFVYSRQRKPRQSIEPIEPTSNETLSVRAPETAHIESHANSGRFTQSSSSTTLFGAATYSRPETVSTNRSLPASRVRTARAALNPFADPPRNKAYDVLAGRPRSTTLTDRGSWIENPFKDPASERFDPFGELQQKARRERIQYMEQIRREAEARTRDRVESEGGQGRMGSGVTIEGIGILDRSDKNMYR